MVRKRLTDGTRIAQLLASEVTGHERSLAGTEITDADPDVTPTVDGALAFRVGRGDERVADVFVQPDRVRVEFSMAPATAAQAARQAGLRVRPKGVDPPRTLVFVEDGAEAKRVVAVFEAVVAAS